MRNVLLKILYKVSCITYLFCPNSGPHYCVWFEIVNYQYDNDLNGVKATRQFFSRYLQVEILSVVFEHLQEISEELLINFFGNGNSALSHQ